LKPEATIHYYYFTISHQSGDNRLQPKGRRASHLVKLFLDNIQQANPNIVFATDYKGILISTQALYLDKLIESSEKITVHETDEANANRLTNDSFQFEVKAHQQFTLQDVIDNCLNNPTFDDSNSDDSTMALYSQILNIIASQDPRSRPFEVSTIGSNRHYPLEHSFPGGQIEIDNNLKGLKGVFLSIRLLTGRVAANVQVKSAPFYKPMPLMTMSQNFINGRKVTTMQYKMPQFVTVDKIIHNLQILIDYRGVRPNRSAKVDGFAKPRDGKDFQNPPQFPTRRGNENLTVVSVSELQFFLKNRNDPNDGQYISVYDYFTNLVGIRNLDPNSAVINIGSIKRPVYIPGELCKVIDGQTFRQKLVGTQTNQMIRLAVKRPQENSKFITTEGRKILGWENVFPEINIMNSFGMIPEARLLAIPGRVLTGPSIYYRTTDSVQVEDGSWNMKNQKFARIGSNRNITQWTYLWVQCNQINREELLQAVRQFHSDLSRCGVRVSDWQNNRFSQIPYNASDSQSQLEQWWKSQRGKLAELLVVILPSGDTVTYNAVKALFDREGITNVCVLAENLCSKYKSRRLGQYAANVAYKINAKLGGTNHSLSANLDDMGTLFGTDNVPSTMMIGFDVNHPASGPDTLEPSVASIVASVHPNDLGQWPGQLGLFRSRTEIARHPQDMITLRDMYSSRLNLWHNRNNKLPEQIILFRDGVSDSQFRQVTTTELGLLETACELTGKNYGIQSYRPKLAIIVVTKRHHTRFYPHPSNSGDRNGNTRPGTIIDSGISPVCLWDFYLQAHAAIQGTAKTSHYIVLHDEIFRPHFGEQNAADGLQNFVHKFCYLFQRATKAVSVCPPAYYADLLCERGRRFLLAGEPLEMVPFRKTKPDGPLAAIRAWEKEKRQHEETIERFYQQLWQRIMINNRGKDKIFYI
jgi:eukaryotic translation initiation factor 2C